MFNRYSLPKPLGLASLRRRAGRRKTRSRRSRVPTPQTRKQLAAFVRRYLGVSVPDRRLCQDHDSPMDYLAASFFGQEDLLVWASRGGGKTMLAAVATLLDVIFRPPVKICILGGSFDQSDRLAEYVRLLLTRQPGLVDGRPTRSRVRIIGGSEIQVLAQSQRAVRGLHVPRVRCDEIDLFDEQVWEAVQFVTQSQSGQDRADAPARGSVEVLSTLHRPGGLMQRLTDEAERSGSPSARGGFRLLTWCLWEVIERCPPERSCDDCPLAEDCQGVARDGCGYFRIDDAIAIKARSSRAAWRSEMLCQGARRADLVFEEFDRARHVRRLSYCADWPLYRAIDFGYASPMVCLWVQVTPAGCVHVLDEYVRTRLPLDQHAAAILRRDPGPVATTFVDPAGRQKEATSGAACTELLAAGGIPCNWRTSSIAEGLELIRAALAPAMGSPRLLIDASCTHLIDAFETYHYPPAGAAGPADKPVKDGPDHFIDALRYFFVNRMRPKIAIERTAY